MNEKLLQFIWQYALFEPNNLRLKDGQKITILNRGLLNKDAGPDFSNVKIQIENTIWAGNIEIHIKETDWLKHKHQNDARYANIILHVVYEADSVKSIGNFPVLELKSHIHKTVLDTYGSLINNIENIPCYQSINDVPNLIIDNWLQRMLIEKWEKRFIQWKKTLEIGQGNWAQLCYQLFCRNLGAKVNDDAFEMLAINTPLSILAKHKNNITHLEAILFGQAGMIPSQPIDPYEIELQVHYAFFKQKYGLKALNISIWKFMRMRPANFPSIRIAQLANLLHHSEQLFSKMLSLKKLSEINDLFHFGTSEYWYEHYTFQNKSKANTKKFLGDTMQQLIWINTIVPLQYFYAIEQGQQKDTQEILSKLVQCPAEENQIIKVWKNIGIKVKDAFTSQSLIHLFKEYCSQKRCLECSIGLSVLKKA